MATNLSVDDSDAGPNSPRTVFVLHHVAREGEEDEDIKFIGVYSTLQAGRAAIDRLVARPGFAEEPDSFSLDEYEIDRDHWTKGFVTVVQ